MKKILFILLAASFFVGCKPSKYEEQKADFEKVVAAFNEYKQTNEQCYDLLNVANNTIFNDDIAESEKAQIIADDGKEVAELYVLVDKKEDAFLDTWTEYANKYFERNEDGKYIIDGGDFEKKYIKDGGKTTVQNISEYYLDRKTLKLYMVYSDNSTTWLNNH